jgi:hypothetical protein
MKTIDKIIAYCKKVEKAERPKQSDKEEYSHGKYAVASSVLKLVELNQPEPPTFRLMSDYGYRHQKVTYLLEGINGNRSWQEGMLIAGGIQLRQGGVFAESNDFKGIYGQIKGWFLLLPNPNKIKPC